MSRVPSTSNRTIRRNPERAVKLLAFSPRSHPTLRSAKYRLPSDYRPMEDTLLLQTMAKQLDDLEAIGKPIIFPFGPGIMVVTMDKRGHISQAIYIACRAFSCESKIGGTRRKFSDSERSGPTGHLVATHGKLSISNLSLLMYEVVFVPLVKLNPQRRRATSAQNVRAAWVDWRRAKDSAFMAVLIRLIRWQAFVLKGVGDAQMREDRISEFYKDQLALILL